MLIASSNFPSFLNISDLKTKLSSKYWSFKYNLSEISIAFVKLPSKKKYLPSEKNFQKNLNQCWLPFQYKTLLY